MTVGQLGQGGTWPDFQKIDIKCSLRLLQCSGELHRHQHLFNPVVRCGESVGTDVRAGYGRDDGERRRVQSYILKCLT